MTTLRRMLCLAAVAAGAAFSQNSDVGLLFGVSAPVSTVGSGGIHDQAGGSLELNYAAQIHESAAGQLYIELPLFLNVIARDDIGHGGISDSVRDTIFFTPGVRWRFTPASRVSFYASLGGGLGSFGNTLSLVGNGGILNHSARSTTGALAFGGGLDFRLTRLLSLRFEGRDAVTASRYDGAAHHTFFLFGVGFHF
jgi:hypothetical protein